MNVFAPKLPVTSNLDLESLVQRCDIDALFEQFSASMSSEIDEIVALRDAGQSTIPEISFEQLSKTGFTSAQAALVRKRGCVVIRNTFSQSQTEQWNQDLHGYLGGVNQYHQQLQKDIESGDLERAKQPYILDIYWSQTQLEVRQSKRLHQLQRHMNGLWKVADTGIGAFDPNRSCTYADRVRIRQPCDVMNGIQPHVDSCSIESWISTQAIERAYATLLDGNWQAFDAFDAIGRVNTQDKPHKDACSMFRTYQGWMALTPQGRDSGTLQLVPSSRCVAWMFLKKVSDWYHNNEPTFPQPDHSLNLDTQKHALLIEGLCSLPELQAGDTVWWHPDVVHAVEPTNQSNHNSSVIYLGIAPDCKRNRTYLQSQMTSFVDGLSPPDFPAIHAEKTFVHRATPEKLSELGAQQMGQQL